MRASKHAPRVLLSTALSNIAPSPATPSRRCRTPPDQKEAEGENVTAVSLGAKMKQPEERDCLLYRKLSLILRSGTACKKEQAVPGDLAKPSHPLPALPYSPGQESGRGRKCSISLPRPSWAGGVPDCVRRSSCEGGRGRGCVSDSDFAEKGSVPNTSLGNVFTARRWFQ